MGRRLDQVIAELPPERQQRIDTRHHQLKQEVEGLRELRRIARKAQLDIATLSATSSIAALSKVTFRIAMRMCEAEMSEARS
jgi:hypothetical protein